MEPQTNGSMTLNAKTIGTLFVLLVLSSVGGAALSPSFFSSGSKVETRNPLTSVALAQSSPEAGVVIGSADQIHTISGTISSIKGNTFILHTQSSTIRNASLIDRTVLVNSETKIIKNMQKDQAAFVLEKASFAKKIEAAKSKPQLLIPPNPFTNVPADPSELSIGDMVTVTSLENIDTRKEFQADQIQFNAFSPAKK